MGVTLKNKWGKTYSDASSKYWDAEAAIQTDTGFKVLLDGDSNLEGKHYMWSTNDQGVINKGSGWKTTDQAVDAGWENTFSKDLDGDGLITGGKSYQLDSDNGPVTIKKKSGQTYSDASSTYWDAEAATQTDTGFQVLLDGDANFEGKHYMWSTNDQGVITKGSGWKNTQQAVDAGWENTFSKDFDGDGLITGGKSYQLDSDNGPVTLKNKSGKTYSDASSKYWDAEAAT